MRRPPAYPALDHHRARRSAVCRSKPRVPRPFPWRNRFALLASLRPRRRSKGALTGWLRQPSRAAPCGRDRGACGPSPAIALPCPSRSAKAGRPGRGGEGVKAGRRPPRSGSALTPSEPPNAPGRGAGERAVGPHPLHPCHVANAGVSSGGSAPAGRGRECGRCKPQPFARSGHRPDLRKPEGGAAAAGGGGNPAGVPPCWFRPRVVHRPEGFFSCFFLFMAFFRL